MTLSTGSEALDRMVERLGGTADPKRRYEYVLWLAKKLDPLPADQQTDDIKVRGCVSQVFVCGELDQGVMQWRGDSDALITKGLLALLIQGLNGLTQQKFKRSNSISLQQRDFKPVSLLPGPTAFSTSSEPCRPKLPLSKGDVMADS